MRCNDNIPAILLSMLLVVIVGLRYASILQGLPFSDVSDEVYGVTSSLLIAATKNIGQHPEMGYASLYTYMLLSLYGFIFLLGMMIGKFHDKYDFAIQFMTDPWLFYFSARFISFSAGIGTIWYAYKSGKLLIGTKIGGIIAAIVIGVSAAHFTMSSIGKVDSLMVFFVAAYYFQIIKVIVNNRTNNRITICAGLFFGLAVSSKMNAVLMGPAFPIALLMLNTVSTGVERLWSVTKSSIIFAAISIISFIFTSPAFLVTPKEAFNVSFAQSAQNSYVIVSAGGTPSKWFWIFHDLIWHEKLVGFCIIISLFYIAYLIVIKKCNKYLLSLLFVLLYFFVVGNSTRASLHYLLPSYPIFAIIVSALFCNIFYSNDKSDRNKYIGVAFITFMVIFSLYRETTSIFIKKNTTRMVAKEWIEKNIPNGSFLAYDDYPAGPPFFSPDIYLSSGTKAGFEKYIPDQLKDRILVYSKNNRSYKAMRLRYYSSKPNYPTGWSSDLVKKHEKDTALNQYYRLCFVPLEELYRNGVEYVIVSEGYYGQFTQVAYPLENPMHEYNNRALLFYEKLYDHNPYYYKIIEFIPKGDLSGKKISIFRKMNT